VGIKGSRVQAVVRELRGEKIDIIAWTNDPRTFIGEALSPAVIDKVGVNEAEKSALVVVADQQLSLAIGKKGQNVRLAAKLTGWKIDIMSESEYDKARAKEREKEITEAIAQTQKEQQDREQKEAQRIAQKEGESPRAPALLDLPGIGEKIAESLSTHGFESVAKIAAATPEALIEVPMVGQKTAQKLIQAAKELMQSSQQSSKVEPEKSSPPAGEAVKAGGGGTAEENKG
jgi:ERCC4-type nuclease